MRKQKTSKKQVNEHTSATHQALEWDILTYFLFIDGFCSRITRKSEKYAGEKVTPKSYFVFWLNRIRIFLYILIRHIIEQKVTVFIFRSENFKVFKRWLRWIRWLSLIWLLAMFSPFSWIVAMNWLSFSESRENFDEQWLFKLFSISFITWEKIECYLSSR